VNNDEDLLARGLAALGDTAAGDDDVERHLAELRAANARIDADPVASGKLDAMVAEAERSLQPSRRPGFLRINGKDETARDGTKPPAGKVRAWRAMSSISAASFIAFVMLASAVLLGVFGNLSQLELVVTIFAVTPALIAMLNAFVLAYVAMRAAGGAGAALETLRLMRGGLWVEQREAEMREKIVASVLQASSGGEDLNVELDGRVQVNRTS
jgi:hypothetical protein